MIVSTVKESQASTLVAGGAGSPRELGPTRGGAGFKPLLGESSETTSETKLDGARLPREASPAKVAKDG